MRVLVVGAGATGGYVGSKLIHGGRSVTFLVRPERRAQLERGGLAVKTAEGKIVSAPVHAVTTDELREPFDVIVLAVRAGAVAQAIADITPAVGDSSVIVPVLNGISHLDTLLDRYGAQRVLGATAVLQVSLRDNVIVESRPGVTLQIGSVDKACISGLDAASEALSVDEVTVSISDDIIGAMWSKFAFITATSALTCLLRGAIGRIAKVEGGHEVAEAVLTEVCDTVAAEGYPLSSPAREQLRAMLTDPTSTFGPSMFRDLTRGLPVEAEVLQEFTQRAHRHGLSPRLLDATLVALEVHNAPFGDPMR